MCPRVHVRVRVWASLNDSQLAKMKKYFPYISSCHKIYREEAVGLKTYNYTLKITILWICET